MEEAGLVAAAHAIGSLALAWGMSVDDDGERRDCAGRRLAHLGREAAIDDSVGRCQSRSTPPDPQAARNSLPQARSDAGQGRQPAHRAGTEFRDAKLAPSWPDMAVASMPKIAAGKARASIALGGGDDGRGARYMKASCHAPPMEDDRDARHPPQAAAVFAVGTAAPRRRICWSARLPNGTLPPSPTRNSIGTRRCSTTMTVTSSIGLPAARCPRRMRRRDSAPACVPSNTRPDRLERLPAASSTTSPADHPWRT